jgi:8-oxo-dGTP pyrophosphatase MutT (NUDIX family)
MNREIRNASAVIAVRDGAEGPSVLLVERSASSRFLPGYAVFPGGSVDDDDADLAAAWFGSAAESARAAAVRELAEEAGLVLTAEGLRTAPGPGGLAAAWASPPSVGQLPEMAHWVAPEDVPVRFDARYFAVVAGEDTIPTADGAEATRAWWVSPRALLEDWEAGRIKLYWPTYVTIVHLVECADAAEMFALRFPAREPDDDELGRLPDSVFG